MKMSRLFIFLVFISTSLQLSAQQKADIGLRLNTSFYNRIQLEFRKPVNELSSFRLGASYGSYTHYPYSRVTGANDSMVTSRSRYQYNHYTDLRFGIERRLKWDYLSMHADLIAGYSSSNMTSHDSYSILDSTNSWVTYLPSGPGGLPSNASSAREHYLSGGLALGLSFDFPLADRFILNFNANYAAIGRYKFAHNEKQDLTNEYYDGTVSMIELYPSAGIGLRYQLGKETE